MYTFCIQNLSTNSLGLREFGFCSSFACSMQHITTKQLLDNYDVYGVYSVYKNFQSLLMPV